MRRTGEDEGYLNTASQVEPSGMCQTGSKKPEVKPDICFQNKTRTLDQKRQHKRMTNKHNES